MVFGFLKDKLKKAVSIFTGKEEKKPVQEEKPVKEKTPPKKEDKKVPPKQEKKKVEKPAKQEVVLEKPVTKVEQKAPKQEAVLEKPTPKPVHVEPKKVEPVQVSELKEERKKAEPPKQIIKEEPEKLGFFGKLKAAVTTRTLSRSEYDDMFTEFEMDLLEGNVALEVVDKIKEDLWNGLATERFSRLSPEKRVLEALKQSISELFMEPFDILAEAKKKDLYIICAVGVNGSGKTTTLAKLAYFFKQHKLEPVLAAGDTFRAAAIQQLEEHANKIGVKIIKQQYGADAAAVAYDAIQYAKANKARVVLIDTAGRLHSNTNLMEELKKIVRVAKPDTTIFIGEATTGNDCVYQATQFQQAVDIDGIVLAKADVDERGGASISISYVTKKPILFFGTGQTYDDLEPFDKKKVMEQLSFG